MSPTRLTTHAIPYADLSDFFYVWLKQNVATTCILTLFQAELYPKEDRDRVSTVHIGSRCTRSIRYPRGYERELAKAFAGKPSRITEPDGIGTVVFANKDDSELGSNA